MPLIIDFETASTLDLKKKGLYNYARHPSTFIWCLGYAFDDEPAALWYGNEPEFPDRIREHVKSGGLVVAHNMPFELDIWNNILSPRYGVPPLDPAQCECTMARCYAMALPGALVDAAPALGMDAVKDNEGHTLMLRMCKPAKWDGDKPIYLPQLKEFTFLGEKRDGPWALKRLGEYCQQDVEVEREVYRRTVPLSAFEKKVWQVDYKINQRGALFDPEAVKAAILIRDETVESLNAEMNEITGGNVATTTAVQAIKDFAADHGVFVDSLNKQALSELLESELPAPVRRVFELRRSAGRATSVAKLGTISELAGPDGRVRNLFQYHGAGTGRWAGRAVQPHNFPRDLPPAEQVRTLMRHIINNQPEILELLYDEPLTVISQLLRAFLIAEPGSKLIGGDWSGVEGRGIAWLAGEEWKLDVFRQADADPEAPDVYMQSYARVFGIKPEDVTKDQRQIGKVMELACLAGDTPVITDRGIIDIDTVTTEDLLWDGRQWVRHGGVVQKGVRQVVDVAGIKATPDHLIMTGEKWRPAQELASNERILYQALGTGSENLPFLGMTSGRRAGCGSSKFNALVEALRTKLYSVIYAVENRRGATRARKSNPVTGVNGFGGTRTLYRARRTAADCLIGFLPVFNDAVTLGPGGMRTTGAAGSGSTPRGAKIKGSSFVTWLRCRGGIPRSLNLTGLTWIKGMNQGIYGLLRTKSTKAIEEKYESFRTQSNNWKPVFDIVNAGPLNRFTVVSDRGPLIVHNCGYQGGVGAFQVFAKTYGVSVPDEEADQAKNYWRGEHPAIMQYWYDLQDAAMNAVREPGGIFTAGPHARQVKFKKAGSFLLALLPSQRALFYPYPEIRYGDYGPFLTYKTKPSPEDFKRKRVIDDKSNTRTFARMSTYGGKLAENVTQAVCRDFMAHALVQCEDDKLPVVWHVHDEPVSEVKNASTIDKDVFVEILNTPPVWAQDFPLVADCWMAGRYQK